MKTDPGKLPEIIKTLEAKTTLLEPDLKERQELFEQVNIYTENFLESLDKRPVYHKDPQEGAGLLDDPISEEPEALEKILEIFDEHVITPGLNPASPGHLGYIPGSGLYVSALGDFLAAVTNRYSGIYAACPGAARMETMVIKWFAEKVGYPESAAGDLTSGGSIANLSAIVAARDARSLKARDFHRAVVYLCEHTHHCVEKAVRTAGLGEAKIRHVPVDDCFRMNPKALEQVVRQDIQNGLLPWLLVASAGTTDTGAVDPLETLASIARENNIWFHVDGAYGASFVLCESGKKMLKGIELSDSITMDPHKGLFVPFGTGIILVKNAADLHRPYQYQANYLQDEKTLARMEQVSSAEMSPELTRHFRGVRVWLALKLCGVSAFSAALEEKILLARYAYHRLNRIDGIETGPFPDLSIIIFRYVPENGDADQFNKMLIEQIMNDGAVYMSSTLIDGNFMLRMAVLSFRTHLEKIEQALIIIDKMIVQTLTKLRGDI
ncbi:MAG: aminotransferase class V-fold PLP-dependent enzyme [Desulfobacula sp.]|nr:aminotransferase class V-fold PLP-dependent enzyme [Desulfobacula sp.]